jgi:hypothetical protein
MLKLAERITETPESGTTQLLRIRLSFISLFPGPMPLIGLVSNCANFNCRRKCIRTE